jgi:hypothetical protein
MNVRDNQAHYKRIEAYLREILQEYMKVAQKSAEMVQGVPIDGMLQFKDYPHLNNQVERLFNEFSRNMDVIVRSGISNEWREAHRVSDKLIERYSRKTGIAPNLVKGYGERNLEALEAFTERKYKGLGLSERVWKYTNQFKGELELGLSLGIGEGKSADEMSRDIRRYLREPDRLYRRVRNEFGELVLSKNAKMYRSGQGVYRSSYKNAMRLARTEINRSYRTADYERRQQLDFVVGIEVRRSNHDYDCPVCESLKGRYPKDFIFTGWHPNCYSDDSLVLTKRGWLLFDDVRDDDLIFSLNPATRQPEWVGIVAKQKYYRKGEMIHFHNRSLDCLVTPDHEMVYIKNGAIKRKEADVFSSDDGAFLTMRENIAEFDKETVQYDGFVYDLTLERNHIMYIRRSGKCFWGSNCRCHTVSILSTEAEFIEQQKAILEGREVPMKSKNEVTKIPLQMERWLKENEERIENAKAKPLWMLENRNFINNQS